MIFEPTAIVSLYMTQHILKMLPGCTEAENWPELDWTHLFTKKFEADCT